MELKFRQITEIFELEVNKYVLCLTQIEPREMYYYPSQTEPHLSHRWMKVEDWLAFDKAIHGVIEANIENEKTVRLNPVVELHMKAIHSSKKVYCQNIKDFDLEPENVVMILKCAIKYVAQPSKSSISCRETDFSLEEINRPDYDDEIPVCPIKADSTRKTKQNHKNGNVDTPARRPVREVVKPKRFGEFIMHTELTRYQNADTSDTETTPKQSSKRSALQQSPVEITPKTAKLINSTKASSKLDSNKQRKSRNKTRKSEQLQNDSDTESSDEMDSSTSQNTEILTLKDMSVEEVMGTLHQHRTKLNSLFGKISSKDYVKHYEDVDHFLVIEIISAKMQSEMMEKLGELYETGSTPKYVSHLANVIMPEWILRVFMERYKMTRREAIMRIKKQNEYRACVKTTDFF